MADKNKQVKDEPITIAMFCSMTGGISILDRKALSRKYGEEVKIASEWKDILTQATILKK